MSASGKFHQDPASRAFIQGVPFPRKLMINVHYPGMVPTKYLSACHIWGHNFWASESGQYRPIGKERLKGIRKSSLSQGSSSRCKLPAASFWDKEHSASPASSADGHWADAARDSATQVSFTEWLKCRDWLMSESLSSEGSGETWEIWKRLNEIERATERATQSERLRTQPCQSELQTGFTLGTCFFFLCFLPFLAWTGARKAGQWRGQICVNIWFMFESVCPLLGGYFDNIIVAELGKPHAVESAIWVIFCMAELLIPLPCWSVDSPLRSVTARYSSLQSSRIM